MEERQINGGGQGRTCEEKRGEEREEEEGMRGDWVMFKRSPLADFKYETHLKFFLNCLKTSNHLDFNIRIKQNNSLMDKTCSRLMFLTVCILNLLQCNRVEQSTVPAEATIICYHSPYLVPCSLLCYVVALVLPPAVSL